jgi:FtsP/CotA-like multicopper oxidase with cupredoxin domain
VWCVRGERSDSFMPDAFRLLRMGCQFHYPNTTNLHTHGLHISSASPGDNVLHVVEPQTDYEYTYEIPANHAGGTFW